MNYKNKTGLSKNASVKAYILIALLGCITIAALGLCIYSIVIRSYIFAICYIIAAVWGAMYTVIKINSSIPQYIADDDESLYFCSWQNGFFPFKSDKGFFGEFIPDRVCTDSVYLREIKSITVGSGNYLLRALEDSSFGKEYSEVKKKFPAMIKGIEFFHVIMNDGSEHYMPITDFDAQTVADIIKDAKKQSAGMKFSTVNKQIRHLVPQPEENKFSW